MNVGDLSDWDGGGRRRFWGAVGPDECTVLDALLNLVAGDDTAVQFVLNYGRSSDVVNIDNRSRITALMKVGMTVWLRCNQTDKADGDDTDKLHVDRGVKIVGWR